MIDDLIILVKWTPAVWNWHVSFRNEPYTSNEQHTFTGTYLELPPLDGSLDVDIQAPSGGVSVRLPAGFVRQHAGVRERSFSAVFPYMSTSRTERRWLTITCVQGMRYLQWQKSIITATSSL